MRDTDFDWTLIGNEEPYYGVLTDPRFLRANIDAALIEEFYLGGEIDTNFHLSQIARVYPDFRRVQR